MTKYPLCYRKYTYMYKAPKHKCHKQNTCVWMQSWKRMKEGENDG